MRKSEITASGTLAPASRAPSDDRSGKRTGLGASEPTISDNGLLCQLQVGFRAELDVASIWESVRVFTLTALIGVGPSYEIDM